MLADQKKYKEVPPPGYRGAQIGDIPCEMCDHCQSYDNDAQYYCFKFHKKVENFTTCNDQS